jgi:hypothetical protein
VTERRRARLRGPSRGYVPDGVVTLRFAGDTMVRGLLFDDASLEKL